MAAAFEIHSTTSSHFLPTIFFPPFTCQVYQDSFSTLNKPHSLFWHIIEEECLRVSDYHGLANRAADSQTNEGQNKLYNNVENCWIVSFATTSQSRRQDEGIFCSKQANCMRNTDMRWKVKAKLREYRLLLAPSDCRVEFTQPMGAYTYDVCSGWGGDEGVPKKQTT